MSNASQSDDRKDDDRMAPPDHELRADCAATHATMEAAVDGFTKAVDEFRSSNKEIDRRVTTLENSNKTLWREVKDEVLPELRKIPGEARAAFDEHKRDCPAYVKVMKRAVDSDSGEIQNTYSRDQTGQVETGKPAVTVGEPRRSLWPVSPVALRWVLYIGLLIGGIVAGFAGAVGWVNLDGKEQTAKPERRDRHRDRRPARIPETVSAQPQDIYDTEVRESRATSEL